MTETENAARSDLLVVGAVVGIQGGHRPPGRFPWDELRAVLHNEGNVATPPLQNESCNYIT